MDLKKEVNEEVKEEVKEEAKDTSAARLEALESTVKELKDTLTATKKELHDAQVMNQKLLLKVEDKEPTDDELFAGFGRRK